MERSEAEAIYDAGREVCVEFILELAARVERHEERLVRLEAHARQDSRTSPSRHPQIEQLSNVVDEAVKDHQAATLSSVISLSSLSSSVTRIPSLNSTPASTSATSSWPLNRRQRSSAASSSL
jgi:hypothetical protein